MATMSQSRDSFKIQGCDKVVLKHCGKVVTTLSFLYGLLMILINFSISVSSGLEHLFKHFFSR